RAFFSFSYPGEEYSTEEKTHVKTALVANLFKLACWIPVIGVLLSGFVACHAFIDDDPTITKVDVVARAILSIVGFPVLAPIDLAFTAAKLLYDGGRALVNHWKASPEPA